MLVQQGSVKKDCTQKNRAGFVFPLAVESMSSQMLNVIFGLRSCCKRNSRLGQALAVIRISDHSAESPKTLTAAKSNHPNYYLSSVRFSQNKVKIIYWSVVLGCVLLVIRFKSVNRRSLFYTLH